MPPWKQIFFDNFVLAQKILWSCFINQRNKNKIFTRHEAQNSVKRHRFLGLFWTGNRIAALCKIFFYKARGTVKVAIFAWIVWPLSIKKIGSSRTFRWCPRQNQKYWFLARLKNCVQSHQTCTCTCLNCRHIFNLQGWTLPWIVTARRGVAQFKFKSI